MQAGWKCNEHLSSFSTFLIYSAGIFKKLSTYVTIIIIIDSSKFSKLAPMSNLTQSPVLRLVVLEFRRENVIGSRIYVIISVVSSIFVYRFQYFSPNGRILKEFGNDDRKSVV